MQLIKLASPSVLPIVCIILSFSAAGSEQFPHVENDRLRVAVSADGCQLSDFTDLAARHPHLAGKTRQAALWQLELKSNGRSVTIDPSHAKSFRVVRMDQPGGGLKMLWQGIADGDVQGVNVEVVVRLRDNESVSEWSINVTKPAELALSKVTFPRLGPLTPQTGETLAVPAWMGEMTQQPRRVLCPSDGKPRRLEWDYPGRLSLQCVAWYGGDGPGIYLACPDANAFRKAFAFRGDAAGVGCEVVHFPLDQALGVPQYQVPYRTEIGGFRGDWMTVAEQYRDWGLQQKWAKESRLRQGLVPQWLLNTGAWVWNRGRSPGVLPPAAMLQKELTLPVSVFWHWWHGCPYDDGFPEYLPPREGSAAFREALAKAHDEKLHAIVYMNQRLWGTTTRSWQEEGAEPFAVRGADGKVFSQVYNIFTKHPCAAMCLATPFWRNKYAGIAQSAVHDLHVDGIYMDQACATVPCYAVNHAHPVGGGDSWLRGFNDLADSIRERCRDVPGTALAGEGCGEAWLPSLDLMLTLQVSRERYAALNDIWEPIPFFHAVYHSEAVCYGTYSSLVTPPYDELWPADTKPKNCLTLLDRKYSKQFYLEQARAFVWGQQPAIANFFPDQLQQRAEELAFFLQLARLRHRVPKYLLCGQFLRPPVLHTPSATSDFSRLSIYAGQDSIVTGYRKEHPLVLAGAWRAADGQLAIALANIADQPMPLALEIDAKYYRLSTKTAVRWLDESGDRPCDGWDAARNHLDLTLPQRSGCILEFTE